MKVLLLSLLFGIAFAQHYGGGSGGVGPDGVRNRYFILGHGKVGPISTSIYGPSLGHSASYRPSSTYGGSVGGASYGGHGGSGGYGGSGGSAGYGGSGGSAGYGGRGGSAGYGGSGASAAYGVSSGVAAYGGSSGSAAYGAGLAGGSGYGHGAGLSGGSGYGHGSGLSGGSGYGHGSGLSSGIYGPSVSTSRGHGSAGYGGSAVGAYGPSGSTHGSYGAYRPSSHGSSSGGGYGASGLGGYGQGVSSHSSYAPAVSSYSAPRSYSAPVVGHSVYGPSAGSQGGSGSYGGHDDLAQPTPYEFGYKVNNEHGDELSRQESGDGHGNVKGSYGYRDNYGIFRHVEYEADHAGFRANVKTNEPGTDNQDPADVHMQVEHGGYGGRY